MYAGQDTGHNPGSPSAFGKKNRVEPSDHADQILKQKTFTISAKNIAYILILETDTDTY